MNYEFVVNSHCIIGEGPVWDSDTQKLWFIDVRDQKVFCCDNRTLEKTLSFDQPVGFAVLREKGGFVLGLRDGYYFSDMDGNITPIADPEPGRTDGRFNDGKVDPQGRVWGGTMCMTDGIEPGPDSGLYCLDENLKMTTKLTSVLQANGMAWNKEQDKFYFVDTMRRNVTEYRYDPQTGTLSEGRECIKVPEKDGLPDGMCLDDEGMVWLALWGGYGVVRYDPTTGEILDKVELPCPNVTSCCFGGEKLDELYITTAAILTDTQKYPLAGGVFKVKPGVCGRPSYKFKG